MGPPPLPPPEEPTVASTMLPTSVADDGRLPLAADVAKEAKASPSTTARTHHGRAPRRAIQAIHHDGNGELIPDPSRPQADVDHSGHTRRVFLAHPRMDQRQDNTDRFLLRPHLALHAHIQQICPFSPSTPKPLQQRSHEASVHHAHEKPSASNIKPAAMIQRPGFSIHGHAPLADGLAPFSFTIQVDDRPLHAASSSAHDGPPISHAVLPSRPTTSNRQPQSMMPTTAAHVAIDSMETCQPNLGKNG
ncbi:hypothetical protein ACLOJK_005483 [Asimina triloba]